MAVTVGYQGTNGTFSEIAVMKYFEDREYEPKNYRNFSDILNDLDCGVLDYALLPVENTTTGIISRSVDLFRNYGIHAVGEINVPIRQNLITLPEAKLEDIREIYSHPEAISQCAQFFADHPGIKAVAFQDTARSAEYVRDCNDIHKAAIGSQRAAEYYGLKSLMKAVQDSNTNMTRFLCVTEKNEISPDADKVSLYFAVKHEPGSLYQVLGVLAGRKINLLKLESRPIPGQMFEYCFYLDFSGTLLDDNIRGALAEIRRRCTECRVIGCYKAAPVEFQEGRTQA
ncbi:MAG: prephenate dehydratase [Solobacterium sp.]|nr:prephenate dehydratase [Solobacterium sp.]